MFEEYDDILNIEDLMDILDIGKNTAYKLINSGQIPSLKINRTHKIPKKGLENFVLKHCDLQNTN